MYLKTFENIRYYLHDLCIVCNFVDILQTWIHLSHLLSPDLLSFLSSSIFPIDPVIWQCFNLDDVFIYQLLCPISMLLVLVVYIYQVLCKHNIIIIVWRKLVHAFPFSLKAWEYCMIENWIATKLLPNIDTHGSVHLWCNFVILKSL